MTGDELRTRGPFGVREVSKIHHDARGPKDGEESSQSERGAIAAQNIVVKKEGQNAEGNDGQEGGSGIEGAEMKRDEFDRDERGLGGAEMAGSSSLNFATARFSSLG